MRSTIDLSSGLITNTPLNIEIFTGRVFKIPSELELPFYLFIYSFINYLWHKLCIYGKIQRLRRQRPCLHGVYILEREIENNETINRNIVSESD